MSDPCCSNMDWSEEDQTKEHHSLCPTFAATLKDEMRAFMNSVFTRYTTQTITLKFICPDCNQEGDYKFIVLTDQNEVTCPHCGSARTIKLELRP